jgi:hypothetical protein
VTPTDSQTRRSLLDRLAGYLAVPELTRGRIAFAFTVSALTDALQLLLGPLGWVFIDEILDVIAMVLTCGALGFHMLLLPTFVIELVPVADMLPTWTGCTAAVVFLRRRHQTPSSVPPPMPEKMARVTAVNTPDTPTTPSVPGQAQTPR